MKRRMVKFKINEISLVDNPAQKPAKIAILKREEPAAVTKAGIGARLALTSPTAGHGHQLVLMQGGPSGLNELRSGQTSYNDGHQHEWLMDDAGNIILAEAMGHTHGIGVMVMKADEAEAILAAAEKREFSEDRRQALADSGDAMPDGSFPIVTASDLHNAIQAFGRAKNSAAVAKHIRSRARALGLSNLLPDSGALAKADPDNDPLNTMTPEQLAALQKQAQDAQARAERAEAIVKLAAPQRAHFDGLLPVAQEQFLKLSDAERNAQVRTAADADPVVYTDSRGKHYRKSHDADALAAVKDNDELRKGIAAAEAREKRAQFEKRATIELPHLKGEDGVKASLLEAVEGIKDEAVRKSALEILKSKDAGLALATARLSKGGAEGEQDPHTVLETITDEIQKADPSLSREKAFVKATETAKGRDAFRATRRAPAARS